MLVTTVQKTIPPQNKFNLLSFIPSTYYCLSNVLSYKYNKNKIQKSTKHINHSAFFIKHRFVPFLFSHPPYSHLLRSYRENKIANLVRRRSKEDPRKVRRKVRRKNYCSFFRFSIFRKNGEYFTDISLLPLQQPLVRHIKNGYTLCLGWLHPLVQMATPSGTKGVALAKAELPNNLKVR